MVKLCATSTNVSKIKVEENNRKVIINNSENKTFTVTEVDGCLIKNAISCDWLVSQNETGDLLIELKGSDVQHAIKQITQTADYLKSKKLLNGAMAGLIMSAKYPRFDTSIQKGVNAFTKKYKSPLHVVCNSREFEFLNLFKFTGIQKS